MKLYHIEIDNVICGSEETLKEARAKGETLAAILGLESELELKEMAGTGYLCVQLFQPSIADAIVVTGEDILQLVEARMTFKLKRVLHVKA